MFIVHQRHQMRYTREQEHNLYVKPYRRPRSNIEVRVC